MHFEVYRRKDGLWAWRLVSRGHVMATDHSQGFTRRASALRSIDRVVDGLLRFARVDADTHDLVLDFRVDIVED